MNNILAKKLEDEFFSRNDQHLIEKLRALQEMKETKETLSKISGIKNEAVLQKLFDLDVRPEALASLCLVPLVEIAWADGTVDEKEQKAILASAEKMGMQQGSIDYDLLKQWMTSKPGAELLTAWEHYTQGLCEQLTQEEKRILQSELLSHARSIAYASGGILGLGIGNRISKAEEEMLGKLEATFRDC
jgi:uncharacterized tellurite resistance protein B-like protein